MPYQDSCKVFLRLQDGLCDLFWLNVTRDGSVILGTSYRGTQSVHMVLEESGIRSEGEFETESTSENPKITFHSSGYYKIGATIGTTHESMDRCTILGPKLEEIDDPRRMVEVVLPEIVSYTNRNESGADIVLDARVLPPGTLRCTVWCCSLPKFREFMKNPSKVTDTSTAECTSAFEDGSRAWVFTLRTSQSDKIASDRFYFHIPGEVVWARSA